MNNSKPKVRDQSSNKFLQRIAGKKAIGPPPTPRPIIGEHPVRTLLRENSDELEESRQQLAVIQEKIIEPAINQSVQIEPSQQATQISADIDASSPSNVNHLESDVARLESEKINASFTSFDVDKESQKLLESAPENKKPSKNTGKTRVAKVKPEGEANLVNSASPEEQINSIKRKYRLNSGEFALYQELYLMTHAVGKTECSFVVSELMKTTGMLERRVRNNLRRLKKNGWIVLVEGYDFENREKAIYRVNIEPEI